MSGLLFCLTQFITDFIQWVIALIKKGLIITSIVMVSNPTTLYIWKSGAFECQKDKRKLWGTTVINKEMYSTSSKSAQTGPKSMCNIALKSCIDQIPSNPRCHLSTKASRKLSWCNLSQLVVYIKQHVIKSLLERHF